jgi:hypothetical protein
MSKVKLALIGAGDPTWHEALLNTYNKKGAVYTWWTYRLRDYERMLLEEQLEEDGEFKLFFYSAKSRGGDMKIGLVGHITEMTASSDEYLECPEPELLPEEYPSGRLRKTWLKVTTLESLARPMDLSEFWDHRRITPSYIKSSFAYVVDAKQVETKPEEDIEEKGYYELYLDEVYMEDEIAANPEMLGLGPLELVDRQRVTPVGRPDLIFKQDPDGLVLIVELKQYELMSADVSQAE